MKSMISRRIFGLLFATAFVAGCTAPYSGPTSSAPQDADIITNSHQAAERLLNSSQVSLDMDRPILVASLVSVSNLEQTSNLGRMVSEQISSRITQLGYDIREMKFRGSFLVRKGAGEFVLSRELKNISREQSAQAVVTGVYSVARKSVFVTLRLIRAEDSAVISSVDYLLPLGPDTAALLDPFDAL